MKFEIFERLNTGSEPLNDMELRNCVFRGPYNELIKALATEPDFRALLGIRASDKRMRDVELVLRFAAFYHATYLKYTSPMKRFFNHDMEHHQNLSEVEAEAIRAAFKNALQNIRSLLGAQHAFKRYYPGDARNPSGHWEPKKFNASLYDVLMGVFWDKDRNQVMAALDSLREGWIDLMANSTDFREAIERSTSSQEMVKRRFDLTRSLVEGILREHRVQPRCFSRQLKEQLFAANPTCKICGQAISEVDDSAVDHIEQYWRGGQTIPENARLTHRYCNYARPRNV
ncbi:MAG: HNH endonuclease [Opitutaceae bacterium]|nr:HNH endonuclease [Opitutaceae bacterium]